MSVYWEGDGITLYHGDFRENSEWFGADVLVTDPPYGIAYESNMNRDRRNQKLGRAIVGDNDVLLRDFMLEVWDDLDGRFRVERPAIVFGRWDIPRPPSAHTRLIWDKGTVGMGDLSIPWGRTDEEIYIIGQGFAGPRSGSIIRAHLNSMARDRPNHPTPKPVPLMETLIAKCPPGTIADPFAGSGSTLVAAKLQGRRAIGVELEERYCEIAARRLLQDGLPFEDVS
jgi:site-specific DNA-methyltransferase (adenine-specific)